MFRPIRIHYRDGGARKRTPYIRNGLMYLGLVHMGHAIAINLCEDHVYPHGVPHKYSVHPCADIPIDINWNTVAAQI